MPVLQMEILTGDLHTLSMDAYIEYPEPEQE